MSGGVSPRSTVGHPAKRAASKATVAQRGPIPASQLYTVVPHPCLAGADLITSALVSTGARPPGSRRPTSTSDSVQGNRRGEGGTTADSVASAQPGPDRHRARTAARRAQRSWSGEPTRSRRCAMSSARAIDFQAPQLVTIVGNQGTGKTRLINELIGELAREAIARRACSTAPPSAMATASSIRLVGDRRRCCAIASS